MPMMADEILEMPASAEPQVHDLLRRRWSPRAFAQRPVAPAQLRSVLKAARWAPSAANPQPWSFVVATKEDSAEHARLLGILMEGNIRWARHAPVLILVVARLYTDGDGRLSQRSFDDTGLAVANLTTQATALGLVVQQMGGFYADKAREEFAIPDGYEPVAVLALGYLGDPESLPEDLRMRETALRTRKPLEEFVFSGRWGHTSPLAA
jgi:nitroreductase